MKLHKDEEDAAIAAAQSQPGELVWRLQSPEILPAAGLNANTVLTSEQVRLCVDACGAAVQAAVRTETHRVSVLSTGMLHPTEPTAE